jgi:hypothetical protein
MRSEVFDDWRKPADLAQNAIAQTKRELAQLNDWPIDSALLDDYLNENPFSLMIAYFYQVQSDPLTFESFLYVLRSVPGFATREYKFAAIGCGGTVGGFILVRADASKLEPILALIAAIYTVEEVKSVDAFCGGKTKAAVIGPTKMLYSETETKPIIKAAVSAIENSDDYVKSKWKELFTDLISRINKNYNPPDDPEPPKTS